MSAHSRFKWTTTFSLLLLIVVIRLFLPNATKLTTPIAHAASQPSQGAEKSVTQPQLKCGSWNIVPSPPGANSLVAVAATSANDAWSVGSFYNYNSGTNQTLTEHWNGTNWNIVSSPSPGPYDNLLRAVTTTSSGDAWAVGIARYSNNSQTLIEYWNGTSWSVVPSPNAGSYNDLYGVTAISPSDVWAVGYFYVSNSNFSQTLIEHWDGANWSIVSSPSPQDYNALWGVTALSSNDVWAVGASTNITTNISQTMIEHWDGTSWTITPSPNPGSKSNILFGITSIPGTHQLWTAGVYNNKTLTEYWDGTNWTVVPSPNPTVKESILQGIAAISTNNIWAVGLYGADQALIEHWDGASWTITPHPNTKGVFSGVAQVPGTNQAWSVGSHYGKIPGTRTEFYC